MSARVKGMIVPPDSVPIPFLYNPNEITDDRSVNWAEIDAPGPSHPAVQYVNGKGRKFSFTLECHSPFVWNGVRMPIVLEAYLEALHQLTLPTYRGGELQKAPPVVLLVVGALVRTVVITGLTGVLKQWTPDMLLKHVTIQASFVEVVDQSESRGWAWQS